MKRSITGAQTIPAIEAIYVVLPWRQSPAARWEGDRLYTDVRTVLTATAAPCG